MGCYVTMTCPASLVPFYINQRLNIQALLVSFAKQDFYIIN